MKFEVNKSGFDEYRTTKNKNYNIPSTSNQQEYLFFASNSNLKKQREF